MPRFKQKPGGVIVPFTQAEEDARDQAEAAELAPPTAAEIEAEHEKITDQIMETDIRMKALALVTLEQINLLRVDAGLAERTPTQLRAAVKAKVGEIS